MSPPLVSLSRTRSQDLRAQDFWHQRCAGDFTDVAFLCSDGTAVEAHACYFSAFTAILTIEKQQEDDRNLTIVLPDFHSGTVEALLQLLYLGSTPKMARGDLDQVVELLKTLVIERTASCIVSGSREEDADVSCTHVDLERNRDDGYFTPSPTFEPDYLTNIDEFISDIDHMPELLNDPWFMPPISEEHRSKTLESHPAYGLDCEGLDEDFNQCKDLRTGSKETLSVTFPRLVPEMGNVKKEEIACSVGTRVFEKPSHIASMPKKRGRKRKHVAPVCLVPGERSPHSCPTCNLPLLNAAALRAHLAHVHHRSGLTKTFNDCKYFEHCLRCDLILADVDAMITHSAFFHRDHLDRLLSPWEFASLYDTSLESMISMPKVLLVKHDDVQSKRFRPMQVMRKDDGAGGDFIPNRCFVCGLVSPDLSSLQEHLAVEHFFSSLKERCGAAPKGHCHCPLCLETLSSEGLWAKHVAFAHNKIRDVVLSDKHLQQAFGSARRK